MKVRHRQGGEDGFLLAETLVTLTISALVLVALAGLCPLLLRMSDRSIAAIDATDDLGHMLLSLDRLVRSTSRTRLDGAASQPFLLHGDAHRLVLASHAGEGGALPVTLAVSLRSDSDGHVFRAEAALPTRLATVDDLRFGPPRLIYAGRVRLRFAYEAALPAGSAVPLWPVGDRMPAAVAIEAEDLATGRVVAGLRSVIAADADIGCLDGTLCGRGDAPGKASLPPLNPGATP